MPTAQAYSRSEMKGGGARREPVNSRAAQPTKDRIHISHVSVKSRGVVLLARRVAGQPDHDAAAALVFAERGPLKKKKPASPRHTTLYLLDASCRVTRRELLGFGGDVLRWPQSWTQHQLVEVG